MSDDWSLEPYRFDEQPASPPEPEAAPQPADSKAAFGKAKGPKPKPPKPPKAAKEPKASKEPRPRKAQSPGAKSGGLFGNPPGGGGDRPWYARLAWLWKTMAVAAAVGLVVLIAGATFVWFKYLADVPALPSREALFAMNRAPGIRFQDKDGVVIASRGPRYGDRVKLDELPKYVPEAFLAAEDRRFYHHGAIDFYGIARASFSNWRAGHVVQGGSTITQQLAKGLFLTPEQTMKRKLQEALMAHRLQKVLSKDEVLTLYLNRIFFGANTYGIDGASRAYFGKPASQLTRGEAALLASLPKAPSRLALTRNMGAALARSHLVLGNMLREKWLTQAEYDQAMAETPKLAAGAIQQDGDLGYVLDYATTEAVRLVGANSPDLVVKLSIDTKLQRIGAQTLREVLRTDGARMGAHQGALLALSTDGAIRVMVGGADFDETPFNRAVQAKRQPGSTFKPFVYAAALEKGVLPTDQRVDGPVKIGDWEPENYGAGYSGTVTVETALAKSINTVAVKLAQEVKGPAIGDLARRFGLKDIPSNPDLSVALGSYEVNLLDLVSGFQVFQQGGKRIEPYMIETIATQGGQPLYSHAAQAPGEVYDIHFASMMVKMMEKVLTRGTGTKAAFNRPAAGKTGTSQNWRDAWFVGFTPDYVAGVWLGNDDDKPMAHVAGGTLPAMIWRRFMIAAHDGLPVRDFDWLLPDPVPEMQADPRNGFYSDLAADFGRASDEAAEAARKMDVPPPVVAPPPPPKPEEPIPF
ncbi:penicillin-binding protein 1A [Caulobacter ginsengisoli]|uniref:peptidoglycan glycosyltransferase n=1 Tax=Caulobacter ginsengisoli TaxID=400775 RepID=A0ABU0INB5_9CAUL|nr:PBP1A family penicillin-binding protein [Caulobacter ginsengisoli]MDQ0463508.1 penicillin-binding protein 1A [Caulobacter ginsengisoli]